MSPRVGEALETAMTRNGPQRINDVFSELLARRGYARELTAVNCAGLERGRGPAVGHEQPRRFGRAAACSRCSSRIPRCSKS